MYISTKEPYISAKEPCIFTQAPYISAKSPVFPQKPSLPGAAVGRAFAEIGGCAQGLRPPGAAVGRAFYTYI